MSNGRYILCRWRYTSVKWAPAYRMVLDISWTFCPIQQNSTQRLLSIANALRPSDRSVEARCICTHIFVFLFVYFKIIQRPPTFPWLWQSAIHTHTLLSMRLLQAHNTWLSLQLPNTSDRTAITQHVGADKHHISPVILFSKLNEMFLEYVKPQQKS